MEKIGVIINNLQNHNIDLCLESIKKQKKVVTDVVVIGQQQSNLECKYIETSKTKLFDIIETGLKNTDADYISIIDGKDYLSLNAYEYMLKPMIKKNADVTCCMIFDIDKNGKITSACSGVNKLLKSTEAIRSMSDSNEIKNILGNKLFKRTVLEELVKSRINVDNELLVTKLLELSSSILVLGYPKYYLSYDYASSQKVIDDCLSAISLYEYIKENDTKANKKRIVNPVVNRLKELKKKCNIITKEDYDECKNRLVIIYDFLTNNRSDFKQVDSKNDKLIGDCIRKLSLILNKNYSILSYSQLENKKSAITVKNIDVKYKVLKKQSIKTMFSKKENKINYVNALQDVSFDIKEGSIVGIVGKNGSGKSTLLRALANVFSPDRGSIDLHNHSISLMALGVGFIPNLTGRENIVHVGMLLGFTKKEIEAKLPQIIDFSELNEFIDYPVRTYSSGMYSKLTFSIGVILETDILLIDEVLSVGDEKFKEKSFNKMQKLINKEDRTVLIVSHSVETLRSLCSHIIWLDNGKLVEYGNADEVLDHYSKYINS